MKNDIKKYSCSLAEMSASDAPFVQEFTEPGMVEPCFNPSIMDILMNPALAVVHHGTFDKNGYNEEFEDIDDGWNNDIQNEPTLSRSDNAGHERSEETRVEVGKPSGTTEPEPSGAGDGSKDGSGTEESE